MLLLNVKKKEIRLHLHSHFQTPIWKKAELKCIFTVEKKCFSSDVKGQNLNHPPFTSPSKKPQAGVKLLNQLPTRRSQFISSTLSIARGEGALGQD